MDASTIPDQRAVVRAARDRLVKIYETAGLCAAELHNFSVESLEPAKRIAFAPLVNNRMMGQALDRSQRAFGSGLLALFTEMKSSLAALEQLDSILDQREKAQAQASMERVGVGGHVGGFDIFVHGDQVIVQYQGRDFTTRAVRGMADFVRGTQGRLRLSLGQTADFRILYLLDDRDYGYALNLDAPDLSEWGQGPSVGYAPGGR